MLTEKYATRNELALDSISGAPFSEHAWSSCLWRTFYDKMNASQARRLPTMGRAMSSEASDSMRADYRKSFLPRQEKLSAGALRVQLVYCRSPGKLPTQRAQIKFCPFLGNHGYDCGIVAVAYALHLSECHAFLNMEIFSQADATNARSRWWVKALCSTSLLDI